MKIKVSVTIDVDSKSFAECYGEDYSKKQNRFIRDDANHCVEQSLTDWFDRIGFKGKVLNPKFVDLKDLRHNFLEES